MDLWDPWVLLGQWGPLAPCFQQVQWGQQDLWDQKVRQRQLRCNNRPENSQPGNRV